MGNTPEVGPCAVTVIGPSSISTAVGATGTATRSTSAGNSTSPASGSSFNEDGPRSSAGAIAGGVVVCIATVAIPGVAVVFLRRRPQPQMDQVQQPPPPSDSGSRARGRTNDICRLGVGKCPHVPDIGTEVLILL
ncbi:hypothetical protein BJV74DRAFT_867532 [Russula compacta]|nr:hypothetical protein BJV74DRAFT_867532 [Russula compacta]